MGLALLIIGLVLGVGCFGYLIYKIVKFCKTHTPGQEIKVTKDDFKLFLIIAGLQGIFCIVSTIGFTILLKCNLEAYEYVLIVFGSLLFAPGFDFLVSTFSLYYYRPDLVEKQKKLIRKIMFIAIPVVVVGLIVLTEGFARKINYPLPSGISFTDGLVYPKEGSSGFSIKFYGVLIVTGALICYFITDHYVYKKYKKHGLIDTLFIFAFIMGVIGSRLWYCLVLKPDVYLKNPGDIFKIFEGGLAIQGGALLGIIGGVSFVLIFRKYMNLRFIMDVAVPSILIAQCLGRWGNFFNHEVYGFEVARESLWYLPTIVKENMYFYSSSVGKTGYWLPLFFIEGTINLCGFFIIRYFFGKVCKFNLGLGYQSALYLVWYGTVRAILEPLRNGNESAGIGSGGDYFQQSSITAYVMIGGGLLLLLAFFLIHRYRARKNLEDENGDKIKAV